MASSPLRPRTAPGNAAVAPLPLHEIRYCPFDGSRFSAAADKCAVCLADRKLLIQLVSARGTSEKDSKRAKEPWRKLLYVKQDYPDNYVGESFLDELRKNANIKTYEYWELVLESGAIAQHFSSIATFVGVFIFLDDGRLPLIPLLATGAVGTVLGYAIWYGTLPKSHPDIMITGSTIGKGALFFLVTLFGLSPILKTLTEDTSSDTIWALTFACFVLNLLFHDYSIAVVENLNPGSLSLNAAIFASVLLASRLPSSVHVFGLMSVAVEWFALFPIFRRYLKALSPRYDIATTLSMSALSMVVLWNHSRVVAMLYVLAMLFITFVCPSWLIWIQKYKNEISGPWDEARILLKSG